MAIRMNGRADVLAIGLDAAEPTLVRRMIESGDLPVLESLLRSGAWRHVEGPARVGSGAVWPSFFTGTRVTEHGAYGYWCWNPRDMGIALYDGRHLTPFWEILARNGTSVGVLDVPYAPFIGLSDGFEVSEWGVREVVLGRTRVSPATLRDVVASRSHPFSSDRPEGAGPEDHDTLARLGAVCLAGAKLKGDLAAGLISQTRPRLSIVVFHEIHQAAHQLWHTIVPEHPLYGGDAFLNNRVVGDALLGIYREVDRQIGRLLEVVGPETTVFVFSLHGMQPAWGVPTILDPLLVELGLARLADWNAQSWKQRARSLFAAAKRSTPSGIKKLYRRRASWPVKLRVSRPTEIPAYDWSRTRAVSLPTDQHGWVRLNLLGREAEGIVQPERYDETLGLIEEQLRELTARDGRPLVEDVLRLPREKAPGLPDLVVHWGLAALASPLRAKNVEASPRARYFTGNHAPDGFCITRGDPSAVSTGEEIAAEDLHRLIVAALGS